MNKVGGTFKFLTVLFLSSFLIFSPFEFSNWKPQISNIRSVELVEISEDTVWRKGDTIIIDDWVYVTEGATLTIEKGAVIAFDNSEGRIPSLTVSDGRIVAEGTAEEKIVFKGLETEDGEYDPEYQIRLEDSENNEESFFRYVEFQDGGCQLMLMRNNDSFLKKALAENSRATLSVYNGQTHIENSYFKDNLHASIEAYIEDYLDEPAGNYLKIINSNFEGSGEKTALTGETYCYDSEDDVACPEKILLKNNWYGRASGPSEAPDYEPEGEKLVGNYELDGFRENDLIIDPVIIIPGITGSWRIDGEWKIDPILHTYDNLVASLEENGFRKDIDLFEFPYEWRNSNVLTANFLEEKIEAIRNLTRISKVDIVAHSMGGLVAREYIEGENYNHDIDQFVALGTPHNGSPEAYSKWEAGEGFSDKFGKIAKIYFEIESFHAGYLDLKEYIQKHVLSVKELLPDYDYLLDVEENEMRDYPNNYPRNTFLENLNQESSLENLEEVDFANIVGRIDGDNTIHKFRVVESSKSGKWEHGMPENFYDITTDQGIQRGSGDGTVPLSSAEDILSDKTIRIVSEHGDIPTKAQCEVVRILSGKSECDYITTLERITSIMSFGVFSPVDIQVVSPSGKRVGKDFETGEMLNEIDGAFYSGSDTDNEFLTIPNPEEGDYQIITQGTGSGEYTIKVSQVKEFDDGARSRTILNQTGHSTMGEMGSLNLDFEDTNFEDENTEATAVFATVSESVSTSNDDDDNDDNNKSKKYSNKNGLTSDSTQSNYSQNSLLVGFSSGNSEDSPKYSKTNTYLKNLPRVRGESAERNYFSLFINLAVISIVVSGASGVLGIYRKKTK
ncbi:MAG: lipase family alpha/beta hydrolase [Patescibacteria group bacterium]